MNSVLASLMSSFFVDNLRNNPANPRDCRLESEHNESQSPSPRLDQRFPDNTFAFRDKGKPTNFLYLNSYKKLLADDHDVYDYTLFLAKHIDSAI